jgi:hypothetical protein
MSSLQGVCHAIHVLDNIKPWITKQQGQQRLWNGGQPFNDRIVELRGDLAFIRTELVKAGKGIQRLQKMIREHLDLTQGRRNWVLMIVAAIYLPLSFTTSLFGMNMAAPAPIGEGALSTSTNQTLAGLSPGVRGSTIAIVTAIESSGPLTWEWKRFGLIAGTLFITLPLSLLLSRIFRWTARFVVYSVPYVIGFVFFVVCIGSGLVIVLAIWLVAGALLGRGTR